MSLLRSISMSPLHKRRQRRSRLGTLCCDGGPDGMDLREAEEGEDGKGLHTLLSQGCDNNCRDVFFLLQDFLQIQCYVYI